MILIQSKLIDEEMTVDVNLAGKSAEVEGELVAAMAAFATITADDCDDENDLSDVMSSICAKALHYAKVNRMQIRAAGLR